MVEQGVKQKAKGATNTSPFPLSCRAAAMCAAGGVDGACMAASPPSLHSLDPPHSGCLYSHTKTPLPPSTLPPPSHFPVLLQRPAAPSRTTTQYEVAAGWGLMLGDALPPALSTTTPGSAQLATLLSPAATAHRASPASSPLCPAHALPPALRCCPAVGNTPKQTQKEHRPKHTYVDGCLPADDLG